MITLMTVIRKKPEVSTEDFRHFMKHEYGPTYQALPQTRAYKKLRLQEGPRTARAVHA
ncbi:hypothetical protein ACOB87_20070 [Streptomyces sp. YS-B37]|uniref:hypothetical protein n=1 Tax=Streptomyces sp. YS-B37 TaxID=3407669 RepID=UPI003B511D9C